MCAQAVSSTLPLIQGANAPVSSRQTQVTIGIFIDHLSKIAEIDAVQKDQDLFALLKDKIRSLAVLETQEPLNPGEKAVYNCSQSLVGHEGNIRRIIRDRFLEMAVLPRRPDFFQLASTSSFFLTGIPSEAFGNRQWIQVFGEVANIGREPVLPPDTFNLLRSPCPFCKGKTIADTHALICIPRTINYDFFTLDSLEKLVNYSLDINRPKYNRRSEPSAFEDKPVAKSYWMLITKEMLTKEQFEAHKDKYRMPHLLEIATAAFLEQIQHAKYLYSEDYVVSQDRFGGLPISARNLPAEGLSVRLPPEGRMKDDKDPPWYTAGVMEFS